MRIDGRPVRFRSARDALGGRHRHGPPGAVDRARRSAWPRTCSSATSRSTAPASCAGGRWRARPGRICSGWASSVDPDGRGRPPAARACSSWSSSAACCSAGRGSSSSTSRPRPCRRPRSSGCSRCCAGSRREGTSFVFISHFLEDVLEVSDRVTVFRNSRRIATARAAEVDKHWLIERMIGRGHQELEEALEGEVDARPATATATVGAGGARAWRRKGAFADVSLRRCGPARCWASTASWARASSSSPRR